MTEGGTPVLSGAVNHERTGVAAGTRPFGDTGSQAVSEFWLDNGRVRVGVLDYGATVVEVAVPDRSGARANVALRLPGVDDYLATVDRAYVGSTMGRFARIVPYGRLDLDGIVHQLSTNAGSHHIHGGPDGFDNRIWSASAVGGTSTGRITLRLTSADSDQGYPGTLDCTARFELDDRDRLTIGYEASTDQTTLCGLSNHVFWNLAGSGTVDGHALWLHAGRILEADEEFVPTGRIVAVAGTPADFRQARSLGEAPVDAFLPLPADRTPNRVARLYEPGSGRRLTISTDQSGMAIYTGDFLPGRRRAGVCLQPGPWPYVPDADSFPTAVLRPGETYRSRTLFAFDVADGIDA
jgi:aldose 1-epimerase